MSAFKKKNVFVNPFYQDGVGRRTGIVVKKDVRKDSDGFEVFDDYWSESENDATMHTTLAAEKENKDGTMKKRSLRSMPSFTPQEASSDREASKVELPQDVSQAAENASALEADVTGSIIKGPAPSLEPLSALSKFKTRQRLSFSEATTSEESQTSEGEDSVGDERESQESGSSSEGTVKAPSSQSELSQDEGDAPSETEEDDASGPVEDDDQQSSQTTSEPSSPQEQVPEPQAEATSSSDKGTTAQTRGSKRRSTRPDGDLSGPVPRETRSRKSISQSKNIVENEEMDEREVGSEAVKAVETRGRRSTRQSNASVLNENELQKDNEKSAKKGADTRRRKSTRQSKANEGKVDKDAVNDIEIDTNTQNSSRRSRSIKPSNVSVNKGNDIEIDLGKQEEKAGGTRRRKSTRQSKANDAVDDIEIDANTQNGSRRSRSLKPSNMSINKGSDTEMELEKQEERAGGTRRSKSTRQSNVSIKDVQEDKVGDKETDDVTSNLRKSPHQSSRLEREIKRIHDRSIRRSKGVEDLKDDVEKETQVVKSRRKSKQQSNAPPGKEVEEEKGEEEEDEGTEDEVARETDAETAGETEGEKVEGTKEEEVLETETESEFVTETEEEEGERNIEEPESEEAVDTEVDEIKKTEEENFRKAIKQKEKTVVASKSDVVEDEDDDTEKVFFSLRASFAVPSVHEVEDEFEFADADSQEYGLLDDTQKGNRKKSGRTNRKTIAKGGKKNDMEMVQKEKPEKLPKSTRRPTQKDKQESKMGKGQKKKASKRGSEIGRDDDQKKLKESPEESISGDGDDSKLAMGSRKKRGKKSNQQKKQLQRSQRSSESTSQASSSDADAGSQIDDDKAADVDLPQKNQRKRRQKKPSNQKASSSDADAGSQVNDDQAAAVDLPQKNQRKRRQKKPSDHPAEVIISSNTASDETLGVDEDEPLTSKAGSSSSVFRSRRSSVHFTTKDMISVGGDISIHQVSSAEDKSSDNQKAPPTTATLAKDHKKSRRSSKGRSSGGGAKTPDEAKEDETRNVEEHLNGQSSHESTAESDQETADQGQSRRGRKKGAKAKKPSKRPSSKATSTTSEDSLKTDEEDGVRRTKRNRAPPREYWHDSIQHTEDHTDTTQVSVDHHDADQNQSDQSIDQSTDQPTDQSPKGPTPPGKSPSTSSGGARSITSTGSILKVSRNWDKRPKNKKNKYSILYTEKPLRKAYIIKPDEEDGVRRTRRQRVRPLEYWRNERPLYERRKSGGLALAGIISPGAPEERVSVRSMRQPAKPKGHLPVTPSHISIHASPPVGTSKVCQPTINVVNPDTKQEVAIDAVATSKMLKFTGPSGLPAKPDDAITISKALSQKAFAAGILTIRPFGEKGSQLVRRDTMIFYVVRGKVAMTLHETSQILQSGDWFFVPKGNVYNITNLRRDEAKLTFFQLKSS